MKQLNVFLTALGGLTLAGIAAAAFDNDVVPPFRGQIDTEFSGWEKMTVPFAGPNSPDEIATTSDDAILTQHTPGAILTSTCNIYNPAGASAFTIDDSVPGDLVQVYLQTRATGSAILPDASLRYQTTAGEQVLPADSVTVLRTGAAFELLFVWDLSTTADTISAYALDFAAAGAHCSLDTVLLDTNFGEVSDIGTPYCSAAVNSSGNAAMIEAIGSALVASNDFGLRVSGAPAGVPGLFIYGPNQVQVPFGDGFRCVGGAVRRLQPPALADGLGDVLRSIDLTSAPASGELVPGANMNFQLWYRDPTGPGGNGFNLSNAVNVTFQ